MAVADLECVGLATAGVAVAVAGRFDGTGEGDAVSL